MAGGVVDVDAQVLGVDIDLDVIGQNRKDLNAGERRLSALLLVCGRDAHKAMHALLGAKHAVGVVPMHREGGVINTNDLGLGRVVDVHRPTAPVAVAQVHAEKHAAPVLRFEATLAGGHRHDGVTVVKIIREPAGKLELRKVLLERAGDRGRLGEKVVIRRLLA